MRCLRESELTLCVEKPTSVVEAVDLNRSMESCDTIKYKGPSTLDSILVVLFCNDPGIVLKAKLDLASPDETRFQYSGDQIERTLIRLLNLLDATGEEFIYFASGTLDRVRRTSVGPRCLCGLGLSDLPAIPIHRGCRFRQWIEDISLISNGNRPLYTYVRGSFSWKAVAVQSLNGGTFETRVRCGASTFVEQGTSMSTSGDVTRKTAFEPP